ncbi:MAG: SGNH/GDSL hydrolase family protein [Polyangiales bacterium]
MSHHGVVSSHTNLSAQAAIQGVAPLARGEVPPGLSPVRIESPPGASALAQFHRALQRTAAGRGKSRILFYGDSHVACDFLTGRVRDGLQARFGDGGPGFIIAGKPWRSHRHDRVGISEAEGVRSERVKARLDPDSAARLGLAGVAFESERARARVQLSTRGDDALQGELYFLKQPGGGHLRISTDGKRPADVRTRSAKEHAGYHPFALPAGSAHKLKLEVTNGGPVTWFGVSLENEHPGVVLDTLGIPGARARAMLSWDGALLREHVRHRNPDLLVLAYGTNEAGDEEPIASYEEQLREVVGRMRTMAKGASCLLIGPTDRLERTPSGELRVMARTEKLIAAQRKVAREHGCGFFDLVGAMGGPKSMLKWSTSQPAYGAPDHVHLTKRGYVALGDVLTTALLEGYAAR